MKYENVARHWRALCSLHATSLALLEVDQQAIIQKETEQEWKC